MLFIDDAGIIWAGQRIVAEEGGDFFFQRRCQRVLYRAVHQHVIGRDAGLAGVEELAESQPSGRQGDVGALIHDTRAFAAQLQADRRQMLRGLFHHQLAHGYAAGEKDVIEGLLQQRPVFLPAALHHGDVFRRKAIGHEIGDELRGAGRVGGGLDDRAVSRGQGADQGLQAELEGIIPGCHDQNGAVRFLEDKAPGRELGHRRGYMAGSGPADEMFFHIPQLLQHHAGFGHIAFKGGFAQIRLQGVGYGALPLGDHPAQPAQGLPAAVHRQSGPGGKISVLICQQVGDIHGHVPFRCGGLWLTGGLFAGPHGQNGFADEPVQLPAEHGGTPADNLPGAAGGEGGGFILFLHRLQFQILDAFGGAHQRHRADEAGQLVHGVEHLFHFMLRRDIHRDAVAVAADGVDQPLVRAVFPQDFLAADAVLIGILFKIQVVEKARQAPEILLLPVTELTGEIAQHPLHRPGVLQMKGLPVVPGQQLPGLFPAPLGHGDPVLYR